LLEKEGVQLTAGQKTGNRNLMRKESNLNPNAADAFISKQNTAFTKAALSKIGENADAASPEVMTRAYTRLGQQFDDLAARHDIPTDKKMLSDLLDTKNGYNLTVAPSNRAPFVDKIIKDITAETMATGKVSGALYQNIRSKLGKIVKAGGKEGDTAAEIQGALDAAMERHLTMIASPDSGMWASVRKQYRDYLVLEKAAGGAAAETVGEGILTPQMLRTASKQVYGLRNYTQGKGSLTDLARAGAGVMEKLPQSGTNLNFSGMLPGGIGGAIGGTVGTTLGGIPGGILGGMAGMAAPRVTGSAMLSRPGRALLGNQAFSNVDVLTGRSLIPGGLLGGANVQGRQ
jgi:hypothetical protein